MASPIPWAAPVTSATLFNNIENYPMKLSDHDIICDRDFVIISSSWLVLRLSILYQAELYFFFRLHR